MVVQKTDPGSGFCLFMFMPISIAVPVRIHHCRRSRGEEIGPIPNGAPTCPCILARECGGFCGVVVTIGRDTVSKILAASLISVRRKLSRDNRGAYIVVLDDKYLIVHRVVQWTLIVYAKRIVFADLRP